jgi:hypothetical protein
VTKRAGALLLVALLAGACTGSADPRAQLDRADPAPGASAVRLGVKWDWGRVEAYEPYLRGLNDGTTFYELVWCDIEPSPGVRNWTRIDEVVNRATALGFEMNLKIRIGSCWATNARLEARGAKEKTPSLMPRNLDEYTDFVRAVVLRYAPLGVHRYAVENEPNGNGFWQPAVSDYERLVRLAAPVIRTADPQAIVLDGGLSATAYGAGVSQWLLDHRRDQEAGVAYHSFYARRFAVRGDLLPRATDLPALRAALRSEQAARNLAFLEATFRLAADGVLDAYQLHFYEPWDNVPLLLDYLHARLPANLPIESWETGIFWPDGDEQAVPAETAKVLSLLLAGGVRRVIWLPARYDPQGHAEEYRFGLFDHDDQPRPGALVLSDLSLALAGASVRKLPGDRLRGVALARHEQTVMLLWSDSLTRLTGRLPAGTMVRDAGSAVPTGDAATGVLDVNRTPVLLTVPVGLEAALGLVR